MEEHLSHGIHKHVLEDGTVVEHSHEHVHTHTHQNTKAVLNRLSRAIGHLESIKPIRQSDLGKGIPLSDSCSHDIKYEGPI